MARLEDSSAEPVDRRHGLTAMGGPPLVGGVSLLTPATGLFLDNFLLRHLRTDKRFRDYLEFRDEAFKIAAEELIVSSDSPVDLFLLTERDEKLFRDNFFRLEALRDTYSVIVDDESKGSGFDNMSMQRVLTADQLNRICRKNDKDALLNMLHRVRRYFAYRKGLLKLDFIQWNSDPEEVLNRIKLSTRWSELDDDELKLGLESHMKLLKRLASELDSGSTSNSISEFEKKALVLINSSFCSQLEKHLSNSDEWLMHEFFSRVKVRSLARECSNQAQKTGSILVEEFLPVRRHLGQQIVPKSLPLFSPQMIQTVKQSLEGAMGYLHGRGGRVGSLVLGVVSALTLMMSGEDECRTVDLSSN